MFGLKSFLKPWVNHTDKLLDCLKGSPAFHADNPASHPHAWVAPNLHLSSPPSEIARRCIYAVPLVKGWMHV